MQKELEETCTALDALSTAVTNMWGSDATLCEGVGWFAPAVARQELASLASSLAVDIRARDFDGLDGPWLTFVTALPARLAYLQAHTVPHMFSPEGGRAVPAYVTTLSIIRAQLLPAIGWQSVPDAKALPSNLVRRARAAQVELDQLAPDLTNLSEQIRQIQAAHALADSLPIDLAALAEGRAKLATAMAEAKSHSEAVASANVDASKELSAIKSANEEAQKLIKLCDSAYRIATTTGLAGAFDQRAGKLAWSMWAWVGGLTVALGIGSIIGSHRLEILSAALAVPNPNWGGIAIQAVLSLLSVGAPLWFAWLSTKQIGQRFRLAEDYAFKASVAKAYEGYRTEAVRIDPAFEARLFSSALDRLDEAPLRLVESGTHGSPWHELANSEAAGRAFNAIPELQGQVTSLLRDGIAAASKLAGKKTAVPTPATPGAA